MKKLRVEIVTPVYNRRELTLQFLRSLSRVDREGLELHTIIVDDASTDGTEEAVKVNFPDVEIVKGNGNLWYTGGTNRGLEAALKHDPDYILCVNNDSIFDEKCIRNLVDCAEKHRRSVVGAVLLLWDTPHKVFQVAPKWETLSGGWRHWRNQTIWTLPKNPWKVELIVGNCVLYPAQAVREVGFMDEKRLVQYGDAEYTPRMRKKGWQLLIEPKARIFCKPNDIPPKMAEMSLKKLIKTLFFNKYGVQSLHRRFYSNLLGAPSKIIGLSAFFIFFVRYFIGKNAEGDWALHKSEPPLSEIYAESEIT
ncbi:MAG: glycosyltransferase family 2 protein [Pyrinomonadaceae bacterium]|nr:glycosyltransferase family 2 protein [Pyrinomonadaceae bacterium]